MINEVEVKNKLISIVCASKLANAELKNKSNKFINNLINSIALKILDKKINHSLSALAVKETKFGNIDDKKFTYRCRENIRKLCLSWKKFLMMN